jgi:hypothetical protein
MSSNSTVQFGNSFQSFVVSEGSPEWHAAWAALSAEIVRQGLGDGADLAQTSGSGEVWQYMCSSHTPEGDTHQFRHRDHPLYGHRYVVEVRTA